MGIVNSQSIYANKTSEDEILIHYISFTVDCISRKVNLCLCEKLFPSDAKLPPKRNLFLLFRFHPVVRAKQMFMKNSKKNGVLTMVILFHAEGAFIKKKHESFYERLKFRPESINMAYAEKIRSKI